MTGTEPERDPVLEWLGREDAIHYQDRRDQPPKDLDNLSEQERQAVLAWLELADSRPPPILPDMEEVFMTHLSDERDKAATVAWLMQARVTLASNRLSIGQKLARLATNVPSEKTVAVLKTVGGTALSGYRNLPLALRVALPATVLATPLLGGAGVGIAAFGGAVGVPALLVFFLGVSGITAVIESLLNTRDGEGLFVQGILAVIATDAALIRMNKGAREAIVKDIAPPGRQSLSKDRKMLQAELLAMNPLAFERHVMGFFAEAGMTAWATPAGCDAGIDGVAKDGSRLILVQCKRYGLDNSVGRPAIQQFKGVLEENQADLGVFVTTSSFTSQARDSANRSNKLMLLDLDRLIGWHLDEFALDNRETTVD